MIKLLCVEDSRSYRNKLREIIPDSIEWHQAETLQQAYESIASTDFDVVLLDLYLPDGDSLELCRKIREQEQNSGRIVTIIFISGESSIQWRLRIYDSGADSCLAKSITSEELSAQLNALMGYHNKRTLLPPKQNEKKLRQLEISHYNATNDYSAVLGFCKDVAGVNTLSDVTTELSSLMGCWNLSFLVQINGIGPPYIYKHLGELVSPLEESILENLRADGAGVQNFGNNTYFSFLDVELLVGNMPIEDDETYGRLRDVFHMVTQVIHAKACQIQAIDTIETDLQSLRNQLVDDAISSESDSLIKIDSILENIQDSREDRVADSSSEITFF